MWYACVSCAKLMMLINVWSCHGLLAYKILHVTFYLSIKLIELMNSMVRRMESHVIWGFPFLVQTGNSHFLLLRMTNETAFSGCWWHLISYFRSIVLLLRGLVILIWVNVTSGKMICWVTFLALLVTVSWNYKGV